MSGVLDRMLLRSRGHLPAVEPLVSPQKTPGALLHARQEDFVESHSVENAPTTHGPSGRDAGYAHEERIAQPIREASKLSTDSEAGIDLRAKARAIQPAERESRAGNSAPARDMEVVPPVAEDHATTARQQSADLPAHRVEAVEPNLPSAAAQPRTRESEKTGSQHSKSIDPEPKPAIADRGEIEVKAAVVRHERAERRGEKPPAQAPAPLIESGEHTEIHITIGSVELRSPRPEAKAPTFRPRVTLDEFLRRRAGEES